MCENSLGHWFYSAQLRHKQSMSGFMPYSPEQAYWLPANVNDVLGAGHWCFFVHKMVARLELSEFEQAYRAEGGELYAPAMMLSLWLYAYATGLTSAAELERAGARTGACSREEAHAGQVA